MLSDYKTEPLHCAFPIEAENYPPEFGLTKREYFAALAMQSLVGAMLSLPTDRIASEATRVADALIEALNK